MQPSSASWGGAAFSAAHKCILVVEDELLIRLMLSDELRACGYHVIEAADADEALEILTLFAPDMIISDVRMPGSIDGLDLLAIVRQTFPRLPVMITSGHLLPDQAPSDGATQFVPKPYSLELVVEAVKDELAKPQ